MSDIPIFNIPPSDLRGVEPAGQKPGTAKNQPSPDQASFKNTLRQALGQISQQAEQMSKGSATSIEDVQKVMDAATNAYQDSMQAHLLMRDLIQGIQPQPPTPGKTIQENE